MIGGIVIATNPIEDLVWINCRDERTGDEVAIYVKGDDKARCVSEGDTITWVNQEALWTPRFKQTNLRGPREVKLVKVGDSASTKKPVTKRKGRPLSS